MNITPIIYQYICTTSSCILTLPLDIVQTKIITSSDISFNLNELKWVLLFPLIFTSQNIIYTNLFNVKNVIIRGALAGIITSPIYIYLETKKIYSRLNIVPNYNTYIKIILLRQAFFYAILYKIKLLNISYATFISAFIANFIGFPIKLFVLNNSYSNFKINKKTIKFSALIEIIKSSISDTCATYLIYTTS